MLSTKQHIVSRYKNINGITCYMNSILHILQQIPIFADFIFNDSFFHTLKVKNDNDEDKIKSTIIYNLHLLFQLSMTNDNKIIQPSLFKNIIGNKNEIWNEHIQQDSAEFFNFIISSIEEEIGINIFIDEPISKELSLLELSDISKKQFINKEFSPIKSICNGMTLSQIKCNNCSHISNGFEPFINLQLSIPSETDNCTLDDCLKHFIKEEQLDEHNMYNCEKCKDINKAHKSMILWETPQMLVIQIKRFKINKYGVKTKKINTNVEYPINDFDISDYIHDDSPYKNKSKYELIGINAHFGEINFGHYVSFIRHRNDNEWYIYNDDKELIKINLIEHLQNNNTYLLFYSKIIC